MKKFFKYVLATIVGLMIFGFLQIIMFFAVIGAMAGMSDTPVVVKENSVFELNLKGELIERSQDDFAALMLSSLNPNVSQIALNDVLNGIDKAAKEPKISGIYLKISEFSASPASVQEIRKALEKFKESGKFIVAYADNYGNGTYYLASVADKVFINPQGMVALSGMSANTVFFKNLLDKIGVKVQVFKVGTFKSAVEPFITDKMSDANRLQMSALTSSLWNEMLSAISVSRNISVDNINRFSDEGKFFDEAQIALNEHFVDSLIYENEIKNILENLTVKDYKSVSLSEIKRVVEKPNKAKDEIAVFYAVGDIDGGSESGIVSKKVAEELIKLADKEDIKAVVLRVNSPGGSAYGSEQIWHAVEVVRAKKPVVVSMGDYAASGGYYISCAADAIVAEPNTITGSIGIFGLFPDMKGLYGKIGLNFDGVKTNKFADLGDASRPMTDLEKNLVQKYVERGYELFTKRCADGRNMTVEEIKKLAEGRVYSGTDALKLGLVDTLGTLNDAIRIAAEKVAVTDYKTVDYPAKESFAEQIMKNLSTSIETKILQKRLGENYRYFQSIENAQKRFGVQAFMPLEVVVD
ncbi:MAG: signal peptide peptidase SppA [Prevotellaceae bacterium]|jgi:protease-4|nr:signal peptide peptidase SppA [Prevotellaceae bacterium]